MNLTKIEKPFKFLSKKKQAGLVAHFDAGGEIELLWGDGSWRKCISPHWDDGDRYRAKPVPLAKPQIPWDVIADEWICAARDADGMTFFYDNVPEIGLWSCEWVGGASNADTSAIKFDAGTCDWKDSLVWRPGHEPEGVA